MARHARGARTTAAEAVAAATTRPGCWSRNQPFGVVFEEHRHTTAGVGLTARGRAARQQLLSSAEPVETVAAACGLTVRALNRNLLDQTGLDCAATRSH